MAAISDKDPGPARTWTSVSAQVCISASGRTEEEQLKSSDFGFLKMMEEVSPHELLECGSSRCLNCLLLVCVVTVFGVFF